MKIGAVALVVALLAAFGSENRFANKAGIIVMGLGFILVAPTVFTSVFGSGTATIPL